jgi:uncharacterized protein involved in exopolysaccharide biosynthesis
MLQAFGKISSNWQDILQDILIFIKKRWYIPVTVFLVGGAMGYLSIYRKKPTYTATISFVLSTENRQSGNFQNLVAQLGYDASTSGSENIFTGNNIVELFKSRKIVRSALFNRLPNGQLLLNFIAKAQHGANPFPADTTKFSQTQKNLLRIIVNEVANSFTVFNKNDLVFYYISAKSENPWVANYTASSMLHETARYFIETKTQVATSSLKLLEKEADSISVALRHLFQSSASVNDMTYNINPSLMFQRSSVFINQAKATALGAAYTEAVRNLEMAKINLQKETPLFRIIDEPDMPLKAEKRSALSFALFRGTVFLFLALFIMAAIRLVVYLKKTAL